VATPQTQMARNQFAALKQAIVALRETRVAGIGENGETLLRLLAFLPLSAWPPASFHTAWQLVCSAAATAALRDLGIDTGLLPEPPSYPNFDRFIARHPQEGFLVLFPVQAREAREALKRIEGWQFVSEPAPHWVVYPTQGAGRALLDFARHHRFVLAKGVEDYARNIDLNPQPMLSRRIEQEGYEPDGRGVQDGFALVYPKSAEVLAWIKEEVIGCRFVQEPPHWWAPATPHVGQALLELSLRFQFSVDPEAIPLLNQLAEEARALPPLPPRRRVEDDELAQPPCFWVYFPPHTIDTYLHQVKAMPGAAFNEDPLAGKRWRIPAANVKALRELWAFLARYPEFACAAETRQRLQDLVSSARLRVEASRAEEADFALAPLGGTLRPFQVACVRYSHEIDNRTLIGDDVGLGKTAEALAILQQTQAFPAVVIAQATVKGHWQKEVMRWLPGRSVRVLEGRESRPGDYEADVTVINYDLLTGRLKAMQAAFEHRGGIKGIVADECFPYHTQVLTDQGLLPIGRIVEEQLSVSVLSCDVENKRAEWKPIARYLKRSLHGSLVRVVHECGELVCTPNHKIWTEEHGYVMAGSLKSGTHLRVVPSAIPDLQEGPEHGALLQEVVRGAGNQQRSGQERGDEQTIQQATHSQNVRTVWAVVPVPFSGGQEERGTPLLWKFVCSDLEEQPAIAQGAVAPHSQKGSDGQYWQEAPGCLAAYDHVQSDGQCRKCGKNEAKEGRANLPVAWRQWDTNPPTASVGASVASPHRIPNSDGSGQRTISFSAPELQGGYCRPGSDGCDRGRWQNPPDETLEVPGSAQDSGFACTRVVRVEVYQPAGDGEPGAGGSAGQWVYNLEIADNHNYVVDGILVSNCHYLKELDAQRTKAALALAEKVPVRLALSGTALPNRPIELVPQLMFLDRLDAFGGYYGFVRRYCGARMGEHGWEFNGASNEDELYEQLRATCYIRRLRDDVLPELPPIERELVSIALTNEEEYRRAERDVIDWLREQVAQDERFLAELSGLSAEERKRTIKARADSIEGRARNAERLRQIEVLKLLAVRGKLEAIHAWIEGFLAATTGKLVVYADHIEVQETLLSWFPDAARIQGEMSSKKRDENVARFQEDESTRLIVCSLRAAMVGVTLTAARKIALFELGWNPPAMDQPEGRIRRMTQQAESLTAYYLLAPFTIETWIMELIEAKRRVIDAVNEGVKREASDTSILDELVQRLVRKGMVEAGAAAPASENSTQTASARFPRS
jgi:hypothetical protein